MMKITDIKTFPYDGAFRDLVFVKVETDAGIYGWGEAGGMGRDPSFLNVGDLFPLGLPGRQAGAEREPTRPVLSVAGNRLVGADAPHHIPFTEGELS